MSPTWTLYVTDRVGSRQAQIDVYESAEIVARTNDVSTWRVDLPTSTAAGQLFQADTFARLEVALDGAVFRSGPVAHLERTVDVDGDVLTVTGVDDTAWLQRRVAHPCPTKTNPPYDTQAYDVHTGSVATVLAELVRSNASTGTHDQRRVPGLSVPIPAPAGPTVTVSARWQNLLALMQDTARPSGMLFDVVDLTFRAYPAQDRGAVFSEGLETLGGWISTTSAPTVNKVAVAGQGEGTARLVRDVNAYPSQSTWGLFEQFQDRRDTAAFQELDKAGAETLAAGVVPSTVVFTPLDTPGQEFGRDWVLGDLVTVMAGGLTVHDQVREVHITLDDKGATVVPSVGKPVGDIALFRSLAGLERRVRQLERV